jgi:hypothetical protein
MEIRYGQGIPPIRHLLVEVDAYRAIGRFGKILIAFFP